MYLISICVPTYNRGDIIEEFLENVVSLKEFDSSVQIVISDNCSTDDTERICKKYSNSYKNIKYIRNDINLRDENFWVVLNNGDGKYLKLQNDWCLLTNEGLKALKESAGKYENCNLFFSNNLLEIGEIYEGTGVHDYINVVSSFVTAISFFGIYKSNLSEIHNPLKYLDKLLLQEDWTYQLLKQNERFVIDNREYFKTSAKKIYRSAKYDWFEVQVKNYYDIMDSYLGCTKLDEETLYKDKTRCFKHFLNEYILCKLNKMDEYSSARTDEVLDAYFGEVRSYQKLRKHKSLMYLIYIKTLFVKAAKRILKK